ANVTDNSALGAAPGYFGMAGYDEIVVNYGNNDVTTQTGGVKINFITRRGGNAYAGMFYVDASKKDWQADNIPDDLKAYRPTYTGAGIKKVYIYGFNFGGPIIKDKLWFFGSYGIQDLGTFGITGAEDNTWLESGYVRLDAQIFKNTRLNLFYEYDNKQKWGRTNQGAAYQSPENTWDQVGPSPIYKAEIEQMFGDLFLSARYADIGNSFHLVPKTGERDPSHFKGYQHRTYDINNELWATGPGADYNTVRPQKNAGLNGNYFAENVLGVDHEFKFGVDYTTSNVSSYSLFEGNALVYDSAYLADYYGLDHYVEAWTYRDYYINFVFDRISVFAQDTISTGRLAATIGLRYDVEKSVVSGVHQPASPFNSQYLCDLKVDNFDSGMRSKIFSPRLSLVYDITGDGKNVVKFNLAQYGTQTGYQFASFLNPVPWAEIDLRWEDANGNGLITQDELWGTDWYTYQPTVDASDPGGWTWFGYFDPSDPTYLGSTNQYDPDFKTPLLDEVSFSYEREIMSDFAVRLELFYKRLHRMSWDRGILPDGSLETAANYYLQGNAPIVGAPYYGAYSYTIGSYRTNTIDDNGTQLAAYQRYLAAEIVIKKRLSNNWMLDGSFTVSDWKYHYGHDKGVWPYNPINYDYYEGGVVAPQSGGSGISAVWVNARWMAKMAGLYQFPYGIAVSFAFQARDGYVLPEYVTVNARNIGSQSVYGVAAGEVGKFGDTRLPAFAELSLRLEKVFNVTEKLRFSVGADCFNVFNSATALEQVGSLSSVWLGQARRILNPRVFRFGVRVEF
ncbi:MAG: TonB-dependent receptor, partial [Candidatus Aminicenantales bacterium]